MSKIERETGYSPRQCIQMTRNVLLSQRSIIPDMDFWRVPCLRKYLDERHRLEISNQDTGEIEGIIHSLVTT